jgi:hypothetical protein
MNSFIILQAIGTNKMVIRYAVFSPKIPLFPLGRDS